MLVGLVVLVLGGIALASVLQLLNLKQQLTDKQSAILALTTQNEQLQEQVETLEAERRSTAERLDALKTQVLAKTTETDQLRQAMSDLQAKYDVFEFEKNRLAEHVNQLTQERDDATSRLLALESEKKELEQAATRFRERFALLDRDYQQLAARLADAEHGPQGAGIQPAVRARMDAPVSNSSSRALASSRSPSMSFTAAPPPSAAAPDASSVKVTVSGMSPDSGPAVMSSVATAPMGQTIELPPIVVRKDEATGSHALRARVVEVNRAHQFIIVDQGAQDGVLTGMSFDIQRGGVKVAQATAVRVRPQLTACEVAPAPDSPFPQVGDVAVQRAP